MACVTSSGCSCDAISNRCLVPGPSSGLASVTQSPSASHTSLPCKITKAPDDQDAAITLQGRDFTLRLWRQMLRHQSHDTSSRAFNTSVVAWAWAYMHGHATHAIDSRASRDPHRLLDTLRKMALLINVAFVSLWRKLKIEQSDQFFSFCCACKQKSGSTHLLFISGPAKCFICSDKAAWLHLQSACLVRWAPCHGEGQSAFITGCGLRGLPV